MREQLQGLLQVTSQNKDDKETEENLKAAEAEKQALEEEQAIMRKEFERWQEQYQAEHGKKPTEENRLAALVVVFHLVCSSSIFC